ncbi:MAG: hypothetical protein Q9169_000742 [Polycauliona sp. 2 TL-2023]
MATGKQDPKQKPPESLRALHKFYQRASASALASDTNVCDWSDPQKDVPLGQLRTVGTLKGPRLLQTFAHFAGGDGDIANVNDVPVYEFADLPGQYDWTQKAYPEGNPPGFPNDIAQLTQGIFEHIRPEAAIVNFYSPGDSLSIHRDVSEASDVGLVSVSLGCDGIFIVGLEDTSSKTVEHVVMRLRSGDAVYMSGPSRYAWHSVPQVLAGTCPPGLKDWPASTLLTGNESSASDRFAAWRGWMAHKRINLNIRQMRD